MKTITINQANAMKAHKEADKTTKKLLETLLGTELFSQKITDRVKTFQDALDIVGASDNQKILLDYNGVDKDMLAAKAFLQLTIIAKALNEGWTPDWTDTSQYKYYAWFTHKSGSGLSSYVYVYSLSNTTVGSRLCFSSSELATYAGQQFENIYRDFLLI
ncbi:MAG: hypothetical protein AB7G44_03495 [Bacteroidia bacterium]